MNRAIDATDSVEDAGNSFLYLVLGLESMGRRFDRFLDVHARAATAPGSSGARTVEAGLALVLGLAAVRVRVRAHLASLADACDGTALPSGGAPEQRPPVGGLLR